MKLDLITSSNEQVKVTVRILKEKFDYAQNGVNGAFLGLKSTYADSSSYLFIVFF